jgi:cell division protein FtsW
LILPANFSTAGLLFLNCFILMLIGRIRTKYLLLLLTTGIVAVGIVLLIAWKFPDTFPRGATWIARIENFIHGTEDGNYQAQQAKIAVASGGVFGKFPGNSTQRNFLPHPYSDFIYAIIVEEYGLIGATLMLFLYILLFYRVIRFIHHSPRAFGTLLAVGCSFSLVFQALINMAVAVNLFPVTGQPLPLVSMGGTSTLFTSIAIGIILSVSREIEHEKKAGGGELAEA